MATVDNTPDTLTNQIHGHEVLYFVFDHGGYFTKNSLIKALDDHFGKEKTYYTHSRANLSTEEIIRFLLLRGKIAITNDGFETDLSKIS